MTAVGVLAMIAVACGGSPRQPVRGAAGASSGRTRPAGSIPSATPFTGFVDPVGIAFDAGGRAWVADYRLDDLISFPPSSLRGSGRAAPRPHAVVGSVGGPNQARFDANGILWIPGWDADEIRGFSPEALQTPSPKATVTVGGPSLDRPTDIAFDRAGTMWVSNQGTGQIVAFSPDQLRRSGEPEPKAVLRLPGFGGDTPEALAFDHAGRLWISSYYDDLVVGLAPGQLATGSPRPARRLRLPPDSGPIGLTVDPSGRLWIAEASLERVVAFSLEPPTPAPRPVMTLMGDDIQMPHTVTFDAAGNAWLPCYNGVLVRFDASRLRPGKIDGPDLVLS